MDSNLQSAALSSQLSAIYKAPNIVCECGSKVFKEAVILKKVSSLMTGSGRDEVVPIPVYVCDKCGKIPTEFLERSAAKAILGENPTEDKKDSNLIV